LDNLVDCGVKDEEAAQAGSTRFALSPEGLSIKIRPSGAIGSRLHLCRGA
jgi:hypothetical protein